MRNVMFSLIFCGCLLASCGGNKSESTTNVETNTPESPAEAMQKAMESLNDGKAVEWYFLKHGFMPSDKLLPHCIRPYSRNTHRDGCA